MELNLRKARKLESKIQTYLDSNPLEVKTSVRTLGTAEEAKTAILEARTAAVHSLKQREDLLKLRYSIRRKIEEQNEKVGINGLLNEKVYTEKVLKELDRIPEESTYSEDELKDQLKARSATLGVTTEKGDYFSGPKTTVKTSFKVPVLTAEELQILEDSKLKHKRRLEEIDDELSVKNISTKVGLAEVDTKLLESHRLL